MVKIKQLNGLTQAQCRRRVSSTLNHHSSDPTQFYHHRAPLNRYLSQNCFHLEALLLIFQQSLRAHQTNDHHTQETQLKEDKN